MPLTLDSVISRNTDHFLVSKIGEETVMMNIDSGDYIGINIVGSYIWETLVTPVPVKEILHRLTEEYEVNPEECEKDTFEYLQKMLKEQLVFIA